MLRKRNALLGISNANVAQRFPDGMLRKDVGDSRKAEQMFYRYFHATKPWEIAKLVEKKRLTNEPHFFYYERSIKIKLIKMLGRDGSFFYWRV